jgi:hypothetical protein
MFGGGGGGSAAQATVGSKIAANAPNSAAFLKLTMVSNPFRPSVDGGARYPPRLLERDYSSKSLIEN